jgi:hypothetical protein
LLHFTKQANPAPAATSRDAAIQPAAFQTPPRMLAPPVGEEVPDFQIQLEPPGPLRLFRLESEKAMMERMRQEVREHTPPGTTPDRLIFPDEPVITRQPYTGRSFPPANMLVEPQYVCYQRLLFEQKNAERYGWDLGPIHPFVSLSAFYWDLVTLPYHLWTAPCRQYECSAGYCLPGDPVPLLLYPPELSLTGLVAEAGTITALFAIFP